MLVNLFELVFNNDLQSWFYAIGIAWGIGVPLWYLWNRFFMKKK